MNLRTHFRKAAVAIAVTAALGFGSSAAYAAPTDTATIGGAQALAADASIAAASWVPYDGNHITTSLKCQARIASLKKNYPSDRFTCHKVTIPACPKPYVYYLAMIDQYRLASTDLDTASVPESKSETVALAC